MGKHPTRRGYFLAAMAGGVVAALLVSMIPAVAANGDRLVLGAANRAGRSTWLVSRGPSTLKLNNSAGNVALDLRVQPGAAPMAVNSNRRVVGLNADRIDGYHAAELVRVGYGSTADAADTNGAAATATITAPGPGLLVMSGTIEASGLPSDGYFCRLKVDGTEVTGTVMASTLHSAGGDHTNNADENCATTGVYPVDAGQHAVTFHISSQNTAFFGGASVWALYVPFDGTGNPPTIP